MSGSEEKDTLCERCRCLSFDDLALGGQEVINQDGIAQLHFPDAQIDPFGSKAKRRLVRLDWKLEDSLPNMPRLSHSSRLGCVFCQALLRSLEEVLARNARYYDIYDGKLHDMYDGRLISIAYLSLLVDKGIEGLLIETTFNQNWDIQSLFPIEADSSKSCYIAEFSFVQTNHSI
jgi:hypothetical protein